MRMEVSGHRLTEVLEQSEEQGELDKQLFEVGFYGSSLPNLRFVQTVHATPKDLQSCKMPQFRAHIPLMAEDHTILA